MLKYVVLMMVVVFASYTPHVSADTRSLQAVLLRIDAMVLELQLLKKEVSTIAGSGVSVPSVLGVQTSKILTQSLVYGETNNDIAKIQTLLATDPTIYPYGVSSGFFGPKTEEAIRNFQTRLGLDPVGVVGPATTALLEGYLQMYPNGNYPADIFSKKPEVLGVSTTVTTPISVSTPVTTTATNNPLRSVDIEYDQGESIVDVEYANGKDSTFYVETPSDSEDDIIKRVAARIKESEVHIRAVVSFDDSSSNNDEDYDENDAEDAIEDAEDAIDDAKDAVDDADDDGEDIEYADDTLSDAKALLRDAEDAYDEEEYDDAVEFANEAKELAEKAEDRIGKEEGSSRGDSDDIDAIYVEVYKNESEVVVEYEDGEEYEFTVEEDKRDDIIEEIADELDIDEEDVEDRIEFDFGRLDYIGVLISNEDARVTVEYRSGVIWRFVLDEDSESNLTEEIAGTIDADEEDVEDVIDFDY